MKPKVHHRVHKSLPLAPILSSISQWHSKSSVAHNYETALHCCQRTWRKTNCMKHSKFPALNKGDNFVYQCVSPLWRLAELTAVCLTIALPLYILPLLVLSLSHFTPFRSVSPLVFLFFSPLVVPMYLSLVPSLFTRLLSSCLYIFLS